MRGRRLLRTKGLSGMACGEACCHGGLWWEQVGRGPEVLRIPNYPL